MPDRPRDDTRAELAALIEPLARAARLALLLDERQPDALRADALAMRAERLFWTLTQLDAGLPLEVCQALVRAIRLGNGRPLPNAAWDAERWSAETAAAAARAWLRRRLASLPASEEVAAWLADAAPGGPPAPAACWLDLPPPVGPPPGAADPSLTARLITRLRGAGRR
jgi:hypothetical protein